MFMKNLMLIDCHFIQFFFIIEYNKPACLPTVIPQCHQYPHNYMQKYTRLIIAQI